MCTERNKMAEKITETPHLHEPSMVTFYFKSTQTKHTFAYDNMLRTVTYRDKTVEM